MTCHPPRRFRMVTAPLPAEGPIVDLSLTVAQAKRHLQRAGTGSNRRPCGFQPHALPTELPARGSTPCGGSAAVPTGFEPATSALTGRRAQPSCSTGPGSTQLQRAPSGVRIRVATLKGWCPRPLDDGGPVLLGVGRVGLEPTTPRLKAGCSTN